MSLLKKLFKRNQQEAIKEEQTKIVETPHNKKQSIYEKYPDGLPLEVLQLIDYQKFGAMLKKESLLPPSYDKNPVDVKIVIVGDVPRVKLTFKSKTSESIRRVAIYRYDVSFSKNDDIKAFYSNDLMQQQWKQFAEYVMDYWNSYARFHVMKKDL